jgi:hypothetical protein
VNGWANSPRTIFRIGLRPPQSVRSIMPTTVGFRFVYTHRWKVQEKRGNAAFSESYMFFFFVLLLIYWLQHSQSYAIWKTSKIFEQNVFPSCRIFERRMKKSIHNDEYDTDWTWTELFINIFMKILSMVKCGALHNEKLTNCHHTLDPESGLSSRRHWRRSPVRLRSEFTSQCFTSANFFYIIISLSTNQKQNTGAKNDTVYASANYVLHCLFWYARKIRNIFRCQRIGTA